MGVLDRERARKTEGWSERDGRLKEVRKNWNDLEGGLKGLRQNWSEAKGGLEGVTGTTSWR